MKPPRMYVCQLCDRPGTQKAGPGRPQEKHPDCKDYDKLVKRLQRYAGKIRWTDKSAKAARGELMSIGNSIRFRIEYKRGGKKIVQDARAQECVEYP